MMPRDLPNDNEQSELDRETEDVSDEYEPEPYENGLEVDENQSAIADEET